MEINAGNYDAAQSAVQRGEDLMAVKEGDFYEKAGRVKGKSRGVATRARRFHPSKGGVGDGTGIAGGAGVGAVLVGDSEGRRTRRLARMWALIFHNAPDADSLTLCLLFCLKILLWLGA